MHNKKILLKFWYNEKLLWLFITYSNIKTMTITLFNFLCKIVFADILM